MKETIFYNREQMNIIRWYSWVYQTIFDYGIRVFSGILSIGATFLLITNNYFSNLYLREELDTEASQKKMELDYQIKNDTVKSFSGLEMLALGGQIRTDGDLFISQDNLIQYGEVIFPRLMQVTPIQAQELSSQISSQKYSPAFFNRYFIEVLQQPLTQSAIKENTRQLLSLGNKTLKEVFGLECLNGLKSKSFVCKHYLQEFLQSFLVFDLTAENQWTDDIWDFDFSDFYTLEIELYGLKVGSMDELFDIYQKQKNNGNFQQEFCVNALKYLQYGGRNDERFEEAFRGCGGELNKEYQLLKDFYEVRDTLSLGYGDSKTYSQKYLNEYKLFSFQQLIYRNMAAAESTASLLQAYFYFLQDLLTREGNNENIELFGPFAKAFSYRYNEQIIVPYLKDDRAKLTKDEKINLTTRLLLVNNGDKTRKINPLIKKHEIQSSETTNTIDTDINALEKLFRANFPPQFALHDLKKQSETLLLKGVDKPTGIALEAQIAFDGVQFYVLKVTVATNHELETFINTLLTQQQYSFTKMLGLIKEHLSLTTESTHFKLDLCEEIQEEYGEKVVKCNPNSIQLHSETKKESIEDNQSILYTFNLKDGVITAIEISDKLLETEILKSLDLSKLNKEMTFLTIKSIMSYEIQDQSSGFGMREQILVSDRFTKFLQLQPKEVNIVGGEVKVAFEVAGISFLANYDTVTHILAPIALDFWGARNPIIIQRFQLQLDSEHLNEINNFLIAPIATIEKINPKLVERYFVDGKLTIPNGKNN